MDLSLKGKVLVAVVLVLVIVALVLVVKFVFLKEEGYLNKKDTRAYKRRMMRYKTLAAYREPEWDI